MNATVNSKMMRLCGFTLIEMLAVIALLGLISSVAVVSLARTDHAAALQSALWGYANLDAQARLTARTNGCGTVIHVLDEGRRLRLDEFTPRENPLAMRDLSADVTCRLLAIEGSTTRPVTSLFIDRQGRSVDAVIELHTPGNSVQQWLVYGLTGQITGMSRIDR